ncbi:MAG: site-2 protease family protein [Treponema sp.]|nr:site-2 protease family protein [Treponema sp.]
MDFQETIYLLPGILLGLTVHEFCHAYSAFKLGDSTARDQGRLTLNPIVHIDLIGFVFIIFAGFGWAKPVQFNPENLSNYRRDKAIIAAAGPLSNLILGVLLTLSLRALIVYHIENDMNMSNSFGHLYYVLFYAASINFGLFIFNLLPIPPLDGSHIAFSGLDLSPQIEERIRTFGMPVLFLIILIQRFADINIIPIGDMIIAMIRFIMNFGGMEIIP